MHSQSRVGTVGIDKFFSSGFVVRSSVVASGNMSYACNMLVVTDAAPSRRLLGSLNGTAQMCS